MQPKHANCCAAPFGAHNWHNGHDVWVTMERKSKDSSRCRSAALHRRDTDVRSTQWPSRRVAHNHCGRQECCRCSRTAVKDACQMG
eukprot:2575333-Prymnesium_polylepis.3